MASDAKPSVLTLTIDRDGNFKLWKHGIQFDPTPAQLEWLKQQVMQKLAEPKGKDRLAIGQHSNVLIKEQVITKLLLA